MTLNLQQLKQILQYNAKRMYFGNWTAVKLDDIFRNTSGGTSPEEIYIGKLTNDIICDVLWYEMSYNPVRFGTENPFKNNNGKNDIFYFNETYRKNMVAKTKGLLPDDVMTLIWQIADFIKNLRKAGWNEVFKSTGKLPSVFSILGADENYYILSSLRKAIHAIAKQNWLDLASPEHKAKIMQVIAQRHPTKKRSDVSYMTVLSEITQTQKNKVKQKTAIQQPQQKIIQTCLPFENIPNDALTKIREKIIKKKDEIAVLEKQIEEMQDIEYVDLKDFYTQLKRAKMQLASLYGHEKKLLNKIRPSEQKQNSGR